jgi:hypothetical protein
MALANLKIFVEPGMVMHACNHSTREAKVGGLWVKASFETLIQKTKTGRERKGPGGEMAQTSYAHMNERKKKIIFVYQTLSL